MTKPNPNNENENTWMSWATGKIPLYAIGIAAGIFIWQSGFLQKTTEKLFSKKKPREEEEQKSSNSF